MLSTVYVACLSCLSVLSVTLVYCGQTVGWIKMKHGMEVLCGHVEEILLLNKFFFRLSICALVAKI